MRTKQLILLVIFLIMVSPFAQAQRLHLLPRGTELVNETKEATELASSTMNKYYSQSTKDQILKCYRHMFTQDGFKEMDTGIAQAVPGSDPTLATAQAFIFMKQTPQIRTMVILNFLRDTEELTTTYFITIYEINAADIKPMD